MLRVVNRARKKISGMPWRTLALKVLPKTFDISVILVGEERIKKLAKRYPPVGHQYRKKDTATNVLSFLLSQNTGEIFLCPTYIRREAPQFGRTFQEHLTALYIHSLLHLKGLHHYNKKQALRMERKEKRIYTWLKTLP